jgi:hypothetical protein
VAYSILKMEAIFFCETSVDFKLPTRLYVPEDSTLHNHHCENFKSYTHTQKYYDDGLFTYFYLYSDSASMKRMTELKIKVVKKIIRKIMR